MQNALLAPILYASANHTDKLLLSRFTKGGSIGAIIIFSSLLNIIALPVILLIHPEVFNVSPRQSCMLAINETIEVVAVLCYFYSLKIDEASFVVPFYQTVPIFSFVFAYFLLGETITTTQAVASIAIILGALVLSFELGRGQTRFKIKVVILMLLSSTLCALNSVVFKVIALDAGFWPSTFWGSVGKIALGCLFVVCISTYRREFFGLVKQNSAAVIGLISLSETLFIVAEGVTHFNTLLSGVALVLLVNSLQPLFVFVIGVFLTLFLPRLGHESLDFARMTQKAGGISFILIGTFLIN